MTESQNDREHDDLSALSSVNFKIPEWERRAFKVWCAKRGMSQVEAFRRGFELLKLAEDDLKG